MGQIPLKYIIAAAIVFALSIGAGSGALASLEPYAEAETLASGVGSFEGLSARLEAIAHEKGAAYAFEVLKRADLPRNTDLHLLGHVVGDAMYRQEGTAGMLQCTHDFRNACSHAIVIGTLAERGEGGLPEIREACQKAPGGGGAYTMCYHGFGHGVFSYFGYDLEKTADFCKKTGTEEYNNREYIECVGGAIMELMGGGGQDEPGWHAARERYLDDPLAPCMDEVVPERAKGTCMVYITPQIWEAAGISLGLPQPEKFPEAFEICERIPREKQELRDACFGGFGKEFVPLAGSRDIRSVDQFSDSQFNRVIGWCDMAAPADGKRACIDDAVASLFWGGENDPDAAFRFCELVPSTHGQKESCHERLASDIKSFVEEDDRRGSLCERIPAAYQASCQRGNRE